MITFAFSTDFQNYVSRNTGVLYMKVSCITDRGIFCALFNPQKANKAMAQSFINTNIGNACGLNSSAFSYEKDFFAKEIQSLSHEQIAGILTCIQELPRAFKSLTTKVSFSAQEQAEIYNEISRISKEFGRCVSPGNTGSVTVECTTPSEGEKIQEVSHIDCEQSNENEAEWEELSAIFDKIPTDVINAVAEKLYDKPSEVISIGGRSWRIFENNGQSQLQSRLEKNSPKEKESVQEVREKIIPRKKKRMAFIIDADGLTEFSKGFFYEVDGESSNFVSVKNAIGEARELMRKRVRVVDVFTEAPPVLEVVAQ